MKKFSFSLEKVLKFKTQSLDVLKNELAVFQKELSDIEANIQLLKDVYAKKNRLLVAQLEQGLAVSEISTYKIYLNDIHHHITLLLKDKERQQLKIAKKQIEIVSMNVEIGSLEKLKGKQAEEYRLASQKADEIELNEFIGNMMAAQ